MLGLLQTLVIHPCVALRSLWFHLGGKLPLMEKIIETIHQRLAKYPEVSYETTNESVLVMPLTPDGFTVGLVVAASGKYIVSFDGWHENFSSVEEALNCFAFGLSEECRLKVQLVGRFEHKWTVESKSETGWHEDSTTGLFILPFWQKPSTIYRQNRLVKN